MVISGKETLPTMSGPFTGVPTTRPASRPWQLHLCVTPTILLKSNSTDSLSCGKIFEAKFEDSHL